MQNKITLFYVGSLLAVAVIAFYIVSNREGDRLLPGDYELITHQIQQKQQEQGQLVLAPKLQRLSYNWQLMTKLADLAHVKYEYRGNKEADVQHIYAGPAATWDGVLTGNTTSIIALLLTLQKEIPIFLNLIAAKEGQLTFHISIVGEES